MTTRTASEQPSFRRKNRARGFIGQPVWLQFALDFGGIVLAIAAFGHGFNPDVLLHMVWVVLALEAFAFGLQVTSVRIAVATVIVFGYAAIAEGGATPLTASLIDLELDEWPLMVVISIVVAVMADRTSSTSRRYAALYRQANNRLLTAQEDERWRLARDVHDGVGQTITALSLTLDAAESMLWAPSEPPSPLSRGAIRRAQELASIALSEARDVALRLRPARIQESGLIAAVSELATAAGRPVEFQADPELTRPGLLPIDTEVELYRIVQEALGNSVRYAHARYRWITASVESNALQIEIRDDGVGFDQTKTSTRGLGLAGMEDRANAMGARLSIRSRPGQGATVTVEMPLPASALAALAGDNPSRNVVSATAP
jgi:signal transduction histidine kinase